MQTASWGPPPPGYSPPIGWTKMLAQLHMETRQSVGSKLPPYYLFAAGPPFFCNAPALEQEALQTKRPDIYYGK